MGEQERSTGERWLRSAIALVLAGLGVAVVTVRLARYRAFEAAAASHLASLVTTSVVADDLFHISRPDGSGMWFQITPACSSALLLSPMLLLAAGAVLVPRIRPSAALLGLLSGGIVLVGFGVLRVVMVALAWRRWGAGSLWITHALLGTFITLLAGTAAVAAELTVIGRRSPITARSFEEPG